MRRCTERVRAGIPSWRILIFTLISANFVFKFMHVCMQFMTGTGAGLVWKRDYVIATGLELNFWIRNEPRPCITIILVEPIRRDEKIKKKNSILKSLWCLTWTLAYCTFFSSNVLHVFLAPCELMSLATLHTEIIMIITVTKDNECLDPGSLTIF